MASINKEAKLLTDELASLLKSKSVYVFDWDGTIFDSMRVKSNNFASAFLWSVPISTHPEDKKDLENHYRYLSGRPREEIFYKVLTILSIVPEPYLFERFNSMFEKLNMTNLITAPVFPDALELMNELIKHNKKIYISSSVPPCELQKIVKATFPGSIRQHISKVLGSKDSFSKGVAHIDFIKNESNVDPQQIIVFGDDIADFELSTEAGVDCVLVNRLGSNNQQTVPIVVNSLLRIKEGLAG